MESGPPRLFLLDMPPTAADRRLARPLDRMERRGNEFASDSALVFSQKLLARKNRIYIVDADRPPETGRTEIRASPKSYLATQARTDNPRLLTDTNPTTRILPVFTHMGVLHQTQR